MTTNSASMNANTANSTDYSEMKENVAERIKAAKERGVKSRRQSLGLAAMAYDQMKESWTERERILNEAEVRGVEVEEELVDVMQDFDEQVAAMMNELREQGPSVVSDLVNGFARKSNNETVKSVASIFEKFATRFKEKTGKCADKSTAESQEIQINAVSAAAAEPTTVDATSAPWATYDDMTAKEIIAKVSGLSEAKKTAVRAYEAANKNRVTIMRAASA